MTKKRSSEISADENQEIFREKVKFKNFSSKFENFSKMGESETGGKCIMVSEGMDAPENLTDILTGEPNKYHCSIFLEC